MPGGLAGQSVPGSHSESLRGHPTRTSSGFGNSGTSERGDKPSGSTEHLYPERPILLAVDQDPGMNPSGPQADMPLGRILGEGHGRRRRSR
jgi:hypothetical protein